MDGKKVRPEGFEVILPREQNPPAESRAWMNRSRYRVIELNDAARQRAAFKRILRYASLFTTNDLTVA